MVVWGGSGWYNEECIPNSDSSNNEQIVSYLVSVNVLHFAAATDEAQHDLWSDVVQAAPAHSMLAALAFKAPVNVPPVQVADNVGVLEDVNVLHLALVDPPLPPLPPLLPPPWSPASHPTVPLNPALSILMSAQFQNASGYVPWLLAVVHAHCNTQRSQVPTLVGIFKRMSYSFFECTLVKGMSSSMM